MARKHSSKETADIATNNYQAGYSKVRCHPLFAPLLRHASVVRRSGTPVNLHAWACVTSNGVIYVHPTRRGEPDEWAYMLAHCLLHLGFGHFQQQSNVLAWNAACDHVIAGFLDNLKFGRAPEGFVFRAEGMGSNEEQLYRRFCDIGVPLGYRGMMLNQPSTRSDEPHDWVKYLGDGLAEAVSQAVDMAGGQHKNLRGSKPWTRAQQARDWFINSYPLLGALAASFEIIEHVKVCQQLNISVAAVNPQLREIYINPSAALTDDELRFVVAHELLHVGLRHDLRCQGRDPFLWNVACDYVINAWLIEMQIGSLPSFGALYDPQLKALSAESIYDLIITDMRRFRRLATLCGTGLGDILGGDTAAWWASKEGVDLDAFYRRCLTQGLHYHEYHGRGFLPAGMVEEIRALEMPVIPWDVELARWFDRHFTPLEKTRSYARQSRRQASTPDIPRPRYVPTHHWEDGRTFGVVLDTSGSMSRTVLAKALGTIASYSLAHDVPLVRVVFCDAAVYDQGYMAPETIAGRVRIKGRGGTILQPAIHLLQEAPDFPSDGPILIITDGQCDRLSVRRSHGYVIPLGRRLPFPARGDVFYID